jgi:hypothetical protein
MIQFTGTATQIRRKELVHQALLLNELGYSYSGGTIQPGSFSPYQLLHAGTSNSGYSFGYVQWDLRKRTIERETIFRVILENAKTGGDPSHYVFGLTTDSTVLNQALVDAIVDFVSTSAGDPNALKNQFGTATAALVDKALGSGFGQQTIDSKHVLEIDALVAHVEQIVQSVQDGQDAAFLNGDFSVTFLADYHNQFNLKVGGQMHKFLKGETATLGGTAVSKQGALGADDLLKAYLATTYAQTVTGLDDLLRRFRNSALVAGGVGPLNDEAAKGFVQVYADYILPHDAALLSHLPEFEVTVLDPARTSLRQTYVQPYDPSAQIDQYIVDKLGQSSTLDTREQGESRDLIFGEDGEDSIYAGDGGDFVYGEGGKIFLGATTAAGGPQRVLGATTAATSCSAEGTVTCSTGVLGQIPLLVALARTRSQAALKTTRSMVAMGTAPTTAITTYCSGVVGSIHITSVRMTLFTTQTAAVVFSWMALRSP